MPDETLPKSPWPRKLPGFALSALAGARSLASMRPWVMLFGFAAAASYVHSAQAQPARSAEELFTRGVAEMQAGNHSTGCPALDESYRLDPQPGALFTAARCQAEWGKVHSAVQRYAAYVALVPTLPVTQQGRHADRLVLAHAALDGLRPQVPRLDLVLPTAAGGEVRVELDGALLEPAALARPLPVDPGEHTLETTSRAGDTWRTTLAVQLGESRRVELQVAQPSVPPAQPALPAQPAQAVATAPTSQAAVSPELGAQRMAPSESWLSTRSLGWAIGGLGAAGVVVGAVAGISVLHQKSIVDDECDAPDATGRRPCSPRGTRAAQRGSDLVTVADVSFGVGIVGLAVGAVLLLQSSSPTPSESVAEWHVDATPGGAWLGVSRRW